MQLTITQHWCRCRRIGDKPFSEPMLTQFADAYILGGDALKHGYLSSFLKTVPPFRQHLLLHSMTSHTLFYIHVQNNHFCGECFPWNIMIITTKITKITKMTSMRPVLYSMLPSTTTGHTFICSIDLNGLIPTLILYGRNNSLKFKINCVHSKLVGEWTLAGENPQTSGNIVLCPCVTLALVSQ